MKKGQGAAELLILLGVGLLVLLILFQFSSQKFLGYTAFFREQQVTDALETLKQHAELVYQEGNGAKVQVYVTLPEGIEAIAVGNRTVSVRFYDGNVFYRVFDFNVTGNVSRLAGGQWVNLESVQRQVLFSQRTT